MMKKEKREAKDAFRLLHLHDWSASGERLLDYAPRHELNIDEEYRRTRVLRRAGQWPVQQKNGGC
jgi:hypothetical protein